MTASFIVTSKATGAMLQKTGESNVHLSEASVVHMSVNKAQVDRVVRIGKLIEVILKNGEVFTVDNFYNAFSGATNNSLVFDGEKGFWLADTTKNDLTTSIDYKPLSSLHNEYSGSVAADGGDGEWAAWQWSLLGGGVALVAGGAAVSSLNTHNKSNDPVTAQPTKTAVIVSADSASTVSGTTHADSTVTVYDHGKSIGVVTADNQGHWSLQSNALSAGEHILSVSDADSFGTNAANVVIDNHASNVSAHLFGTGGGDVLIGGAGVTSFSGSQGHDTVLYDLLNTTAPIGGHSGLDTWTDFHLGNTTLDANADILDVSALLNSQVNATNIDHYVAVNYDATSHTATVSVDQAGTGIAADFHQLISLHLDASPATNTVTMQDLLQNHQLLF